MVLSELLNYCLYIVLTAILPVTAKYVVDLLKSKIKESGLIAEAVKNDALRKIAEDALTDVMDAVLYVNQVYTDSLKANGRFDKDAQEEAYHRAYDEALGMISEESRKVIEQLYGSFDQWLKLKIEASVNTIKRQ